MQKPSALRASQARKPIFLLKAAGGALGSHPQALQRAYGDFEALAGEIEGQLNALSA